MGDKVTVRKSSVRGLWTAECACCMTRTHTPYWLRAVMAADWHARRLHSVESF